MWRCQVRHLGYRDRLVGSFTMSRRYTDVMVLRFLLITGTVYVYSLARPESLTSSLAFSLKTFLKIFPDCSLLALFDIMQ